MTDVMLAVAELAMRLGAAPINKHAGCWECQIDERWWVACNGHRSPVVCSKGVKVDPFEIYVEFNGWPAGLVNPRGGTFSAGAAANEDAFLAACKAAR